MDSILFWNAVALEANRVSHSDPAKGEQTGPPLEDFKRTADEAGLNDKIVYLAHGETYNFKTLANLGQKALS